MYQSITTKYHAPSNVKGSRISARCQRGSITVEWDHALNTDENHRAAALALCKRFARQDKDADSRWLKPLVSGFDYQGNGQHVFQETAALDALKAIFAPYWIALSVALERQHPTATPAQIHAMTEETELIKKARAVLNA